MNSIRSRLTAALTASIAALMLAGDGGLLWYAHHTARREADAVLDSAARRYRAEVGHGGRTIALAEMAEEGKELSANGVAVVLLNARGKVVAANQKNTPPWPSHGAGWRCMSMGIGADTVVFGVLWAKTERALRREAVALLALSLAAALAVSVGAWVLVGRTLSPIGRLSRQATAASVEAPRVILQTPSRDAEMIDLVDTLNGLLARVADTVTARIRFYAAASHELRTPLQALQGHLELALTRDRDAYAYRSALEEASRQSERLSGLVRDLLTLSRLHAAPPDASVEVVDVAGVCARMVGLNTPVADRRGLHLDVELAAKAQITAAPAYVEMMVRNLVENAILHADEGGRVRVALSAAPHLRLQISNDCAVASTLDLDRLFEPFYRTDASRSAETGGNGLGLAICRAIADTAGWAVRLERDAEGIVATVEFTGPMHAAAR